jgi:hypothetical protein
MVGIAMDLKNLWIQIYNRYTQWRLSCFLKKHGCDTLEQYNLRYDPRIDYAASIVTNFYHGYPFVYCFQDHRHDVYDWNIAETGINVIEDWCRNNFCSQYRMDFHRVIFVNGQANICELGGSDYIFFACSNATDYSHFLLRWG